MDSPRDVLINALRDVEEADVPDDLREIAFAKAFDLRAGTVRVPPAGPGGGERGVARAVEASPAASDWSASGDPIDRIAGRLGLERATVAEVFDAHDGHVELIVPAGKLPARAATATKEIALVVAGGRQAAGLEEWTSIDQIRRVCDYFKRLDSPNFAKTVKEMEQVFNFRRESERKIQVRLARPGWELAADAIRRLGGE